MAQTTPIIIAEDGTETHESWLLVRAGQVSSTPGAILFDSEIAHQHYIVVNVSRCKRKRDLNRDWKFEAETLLQFDLSMAQWGAFVSSFGRGTGVPATLGRFDGMVPGAAPVESRVGESAREVREAGVKALAAVEAKHTALAEAFERGAGKKEMRALIRDLGITVGNAPGNMAFAAKSLTEHVENVTTKARADIEAMVVAAGGDPGLLLDAGALPALPSGSAT